MCRPVMWSPARFLRISVSMAVLSSGAGVARFRFEQPMADTSAAESSSDPIAFFIYVNLRSCIEQLVFQRGVGSGEWGVGERSGGAANGQIPTPTPDPLLPTPV